jgi:VirE N-terminal domain/AAA domain
MNAFISAFKTHSDVDNPITLSVEKVVGIIRSGGKELAGQIAEIRNLFKAELAITREIKKAKEAVKPLKDKLPCVTWCGTFSKRGNDHLLEHSGWLCADLDNLNGQGPSVRQKLELLPQTGFVFLSPTGDGLKIGFRVAADKAKHPGSFRSVEKLVLEKTGLQIDVSRKDIAGLCYLSHDADVYFNPEAVEIEPLPEPQKSEDVSNVEVNLSERQRVASELLGSIDWQSETEGLCLCPNQAAHTTGNGKRDCKVWLGEAPSIHCFHNSCRGIVAAVNRDLRLRIGKAETPAKAPIAPSAGNASKASMTQLSSVAILPIEFVDKPLFQANAFHLLVGKKNAGKGTFLSAVASRFTCGELGEKRNVIWIAAGEDSLALDVHPRIKAAGGDAGRVYCPKGVIPRLPADISLLREWITQTGSVGLVVLDPVSGMLSVGTNTNHDVDVRLAIAPLNELADTDKCLIIGVRHLGKGASEKGALDSVLGSSDWVNIPRAVLAMAMDDEDEDVRHVQVVAGNRLPRGSASRSFRIVGVNVVEGGEPVAKAEFIDGAGKNVDEVLRSEPGQSVTKIKRAKMELLDRLEPAGTGLEPDSLSAEIAAETGISTSTIRNAKTWLKKNGLIYFRPNKDEAGILRDWRVLRTKAPRPPDLQENHPTSPERDSLTTTTQQATPLDTKRLFSGCLVDGEWIPLNNHSTCFETQAQSMFTGSPMASRIHVPALSGTGELEDIGRV